MNPVLYTPAVTEVTTPASVTVTLSLEQFAKVRALLGQCGYGQLSTNGEHLFDKFEDAMKAHSIPRYSVVDEHLIPSIRFQKV